VSMGIGYTMSKQAGDAWRGSALKTTHPPANSSPCWRTGGGGGDGARGGGRVGSRAATRLPRGSDASDVCARRALRAEL
jgi:hypothetical protein